MWSQTVVILKNDISELNRLADITDTFFEANGCNDLAFKVNLCFDELVTNIVSYGFEDSNFHPIFVTLTIWRGVLQVEIRDSARAYDPFEEAPEPDLDLDIDDRPIGGLGVFLVKEFMDRVTYRRDGNDNVVTLFKKLAEEGEVSVEIKQEEVGGVMVLAPLARVDSNTAGEFEKVLVSVLQKGKTRLVIDFDQLEYISSAGLRVVLIGAKTCKAKSGKLVLCSMKSHIREVFDVSGFTKILNIVADREAALKAFG